MPQSQQPNIVENVQKTFASIQQESQKAVADLNSKFLEFVGVRSNEEFLNNAQTETQKYIQQIKGLADSINAQTQNQQQQINSQIGSIAKQLSESASRFLSNNDPAKADQIQQTFNSVLDQANILQRTAQEQGKNFYDSITIKF